MKKSYNTDIALADDDTILAGRTVICDQTNFCREAWACGGAHPHRYQPEECGHCPFNSDARCLPYEQE